MFKQLLNKLFGSESNQANLNQIIQDGAFLVDVRSPEEYLLGSVKGAVNIPLAQLPSQLKKFENKKSIIVFCRSGMRSSQAKSVLEKNNLSNVHDGGTWESVNKLVEL